MRNDPAGCETGFPGSTPACRRGCGFALLGCGVVAVVAAEMAWARALLPERAAVRDERLACRDSSPKPKHVQVVPGPTNVLVVEPQVKPPPSAASFSAPAAIPSQVRPPAPLPAVPPPLAASAPGSTGTAASTGGPRSETSVRPFASGTGTRIPEIVPPWSGDADGSLAAARRDAGRAPGAPVTSASGDTCVNVFIRSSSVDGREVVSVDLHGDGLIKSAVSLPLAGELLARAGPGSPEGPRSACVPHTLAQRLFDPVVNVPAVEPAVRLSRAGERWVLAGSSAPSPAAMAPAPMRLAAAATRGAAKTASKARPAARPVPVRVEFP